MCRPLQIVITSHISVYMCFGWHETLLCDNNNHGINAKAVSGDEFQQSSFNDNLIKS